MKTKANRCLDKRKSK